MKNFTIFFLFIILIINSPVFGQYSVKLRIGEIVNPLSPEHPFEWRVTIYADIFDANKNLVPHSSNYHYYWYKNECSGGEVLWHEGDDLYFLVPDGHNSIPSECDETITFQTYWVHVNVRINGILYYSGGVRIPDDESDVLTQKEINLTQKRESQNVVEVIGKKIGSEIFNYPAPNNFYTPSIQNSEVFRGSQKLVSNPYEKYNRWQGISDVVNHRTFTLSGSTINLTSQFKKVYDGTVRANLLEVPGTYDNVQFKDPWFINDNSDPLGVRNKGMSADFLSVGTLSNNLGINTQYKGIFLNQEYDPNGENSFYSVRSPVQPYYKFLQQTNRYHKFYFYNWSSSGTDPLTQNNIISGYYETPVVFRNGGAIVNANLKGTQLSNDQNAYSNNSQRKFVKTPDGALHYVYSSLGHIWYERSTDGGNTWTIANGGNYLDNGEGKLPSIDENGYDNFVVIAYQERNGNNFGIKIKIFENGIQKGEEHIYSVGQSYDFNANPGVAYTNSTSGNDKFIVIFQTNQGLYYRYGLINIDEEVIWPEPPQDGIINGTNQHSTNPTIAAKKNVGAQGDFYLAWQQYDTQILYKQIHFINNEITSDPTPALYSYNSGFTKNYSPSISLAGGSNPVVSWVGHNGSVSEKMVLKGNGGEPLEETKIVVKRGTSGNFFVAGNNVNNVNNNSTTAGGENTVVTWSENNPAVSKWVKRTGTSFSPTVSLSNSGIQSQVSNGTNYSGMKAMVFNNQTTPFNFKLATSDFSQNFDIEVDKITTDGNYLTYGRTGITGKNGVQFIFNVGDIILADTNVQFIDIPDTLVYTSTEELNEVTRSLDFHLTNQSQLYFTNYYYVVNPELADSVLTSTDEVSFRVELVNSNNNEVVGTFDNITYTKNNLENYDNISYQVDCSGIQTGNYFIRLVTNVSGEASYNLANVQNDNPELEKKHYNQVNFTGSELPVTYELFQNFPNPFNPTTSIRYQVPEDGIVSLKIYDILGKEVTTLVNEQKAVGKYQLNFDATDLASGVYIYRIQVNDFVSAKKMMLVK